MLVPLLAFPCESLTTAQLCTLRADMDTHAELTSAIQNKDLTAIATFYNAETSPIVEAWQPELVPSVVVENVDWAEYVGLSRQKQGAFEMLQYRSNLHTDLANVRSGLQEIFSLAEAPNSRANLIAAAKRALTICEAIFKSGTGPVYDIGVAGSLSNSSVLWALDNCL